MMEELHPPSGVRPRVAPELEWAGEGFENRVYRFDNGFGLYACNLGQGWTTTLLEATGAGLNDWNPIPERTDSHLTDDQLEIKVAQLAAKPPHKAGDRNDL